MTRPTYQAAPGRHSSDEWVVASGTLEHPGPAISAGFQSRGKAQAEADRLNALAEAFEVGHDERRDEVLGRMMTRADITNQRSQG